MIRTIVTLVVLLLIGAVGAPARPFAQAPAAQPPSPPAQPATPPAQPQATPPPAQQETAPPAAAPYSYQAEGRRDPFVSLLGRGADPTSPARPAGLGGMLIAEVSIKGILKDRSGFFALLQGPDNKTYTVRSGDKLLDGSVKAINGEAVIFSQDVNDPLSVVKQREVVKKLRQNEEGRE